MSCNLHFRVCSKGCKVFAQGVLVLYREPQLRGRDKGLRQIDFYPQYERPCYQVYKEFSDLSLVPLCTQVFLYRNITFKNCAIIFKYGTLIIQTFLLSHVSFKKALWKLRPALFSVRSPCCPLRFSEVRVLDVHSGVPIASALPGVGAC